MSTWANRGFTLGGLPRTSLKCNRKPEMQKRLQAPPPQKHKTYDDIEKEIEEVVPDPMDTRLRKKPQFPAGAFLKRERLASEGRKSLRYQGMPIRV